MRTWTVLALLLLTSALLFAQTSDSEWAGSWAGTWNGESGGSGELRMKLSKSGDQWKAEADFSLSGADVPCVVKSLKIDGDKLEIEYDFELQGYKVTSKLTGTRKDKTMEGTYKTTGPDSSPVDTGKWKLALK